MHSEPNGFTVFENHTSAQTANQLLAAPSVSGRRICVTGLVVSNGAVAGTVFLVEDTAGAATQIDQTLYVGVNGGAVELTFNPPLRLTANKDLGFTSATVTIHSIKVIGFYEP